MEASKEELGIKGYGLTETTLEEVFLAVNSKGKGIEVQENGLGELDHTSVPISDMEDGDMRPLLANDAGINDCSMSDAYEGDLRRSVRVQVWSAESLGKKSSCSYQQHTSSAKQPVSSPVELCLCCTNAENYGH